MPPAYFLNFKSISYNFREVLPDLGEAGVEIQEKGDREYSRSY